MFWISFGRWNHSAGHFFIQERIYRKGYIWTPFVRVRRRYSSWLGYWRSSV